MYNPFKAPIIGAVLIGFGLILVIGAILDPGWWWLDNILFSLILFYVGAELVWSRPGRPDSKKDSDPTE